MTTRDRKSGQGKADIVPPRAPKEPSVREIHGRQLEDPYAWLKNREDPRVEAYLKAENEYADAMMSHTRRLQKRLYAEMLARIEETDMSVPYPKGNFYYFRRTEGGKQYPIYCRKRGSLEAPEEVLLDPNQLAKGDFFQLGVLEVSPDHRKLAYSVDESGGEIFRLFILDLATREILDQIEGTSYSVEWAADNQTLFYTVVDEANRPYRLYRHRLGEAAGGSLVLEEEDEAFFLDLSKTRSGHYLLASLESRTTSEVLFLPAEQPDNDFRLLRARRTGVEYQVDHRGDHFYIVTNEEAENFRLLRAPVAAFQRRNWKEVIPHREEILLEGIELFQDHMAIFERVEGTVRARIHDFRTASSFSVAFSESLYSVVAEVNEEFRTRKLRLSYTSFVTPQTIYDLDMDTGKLVLLKQQPVKGKYRPGDYLSERLYATAADGVSIPISIFRRKDSSRPSPLLLYAYGAYGYSLDPSFSSVRLSLVDRGVSFAIAHVRGGEELGRGWYRQGKLSSKWNSFRDFICCAESLIESGCTRPEQLAIRGGSAGGLLIGAVLNTRPDLFRAAVADVPFVDVVNTMLDPSLPLTVIEYEEWGNPDEEEAFEYILSYSPYDNITKKEYPDLLVRAGLNDRRVAYWEPAKWVARLRDRKAGSRWILLKTLMGAGHGGASGRYDRLRDAAFDYAFLLDRLGVEGRGVRG